MSPCRCVVIRAKTQPAAPPGACGYLSGLTLVSGKSYRESCGSPPGRRWTPTSRSATRPAGHGGQLLTLTSARRNGRLWPRHHPSRRRDRRRACGRAHGVGARRQREPGGGERRRLGHGASRHRLQHAVRRQRRRHLRRRTRWRLRRGGGRRCLDPGGRRGGGRALLRADRADGGDCRRGLGGDRRRRPGNPGRLVQKHGGVRRQRGKHGGGVRGAGRDAAGGISRRARHAGARHGVGWPCCHQRVAATAAASSSPAAPGWCSTGWTRCPPRS